MAEKEMPKVDAEKRVSAPVVKNPTSEHETTQTKIQKAFGTSDGKSVGNYIVNSVLKPTFKELIYNVITKGIKEFLYPGSKGAPTEKSSSGVLASTVAYHKLYDADKSQQGIPDEKPKMISRDVIVQTEEDAQALYNAINDLVHGPYKVCRVADLYELANRPVSHTDSNYGWASMQGIKIVPTPDGQFWLKMPKPMPLDQ